MKYCFGTKVSNTATGENKWGLFNFQGIKSSEYIVFMWLKNIEKSNSASI